MDHYTKIENLRARTLFEKAVELDPTYAKALSKNTWTYLLEYLNGWSESPEEALAQGMKVAQQALKADANEPWAHYGIASAYLIHKKHDLAVRAFRKAHQLNPNDATILIEYGWALSLSGRPEEGIPLMHQAIRLNPYHPEWYWHDLWDGYFVTGDYQQAASYIEEIAQPYPDTYKRLAVTYGLLGQLEDARAALAKFRELEPQRTLDRLVETMPFSRQKDRDAFREGLRKAGMPEASRAPGT